MSRVREKKLLNAKMRAVKNGLLSPFGRILTQYFSHWKLMTESHKETLFKKIKIQIIKTYHDKLRDAFTRMSAKGATKKRKKKMMMNVEMENESITLENDIKSTNEKVKLEEVRNAKIAGKSFKKLLMKAYHGELRYRLE